MACPTCSHTMTPMECKVTDKTFYWCPRCGTILPCEGAEPATPALVYDCRDFEKRLIDNIRDQYSPAGLYGMWHGIGVQESINLPRERGE